MKVHRIITTDDDADGVCDDIDDCVGEYDDTGGVVENTEGREITLSTKKLLF